MRFYPCDKKDKYVGNGNKYLKVNPGKIVTYEINSVIETASQQGMISLNKSLAELVRKGEITVENARKFSLNESALEKLI